MLKTMLSKGKLIRLWSFILSIFCVLHTSPLVFARSPEMNLKKNDQAPHAIARTTSKISIDGNLNEDCWHDAWSMELKFEINPGETHILFGPNGSGKTSLLMTIMGYPQYNVVEGKIMFKGEDITHMPINERAQLGIGM